VHVAAQRDAPGLDHSQQPDDHHEEHKPIPGSRRARMRDRGSLYEQEALPGARTNGEQMIAAL
jgi:hypothetical protein